MTKIEKIISAAVLIIFIFCGLGYSQDKKEEVKQYIVSVNPILTNVQTTSRNISLKLITLQPAAKQMREYIGKLKAIKPPVFMERQHKMILLSIHEMRAGFYLLSKGDRINSIPLVKRGAELFKISLKDIVDFARKEGLIKEGEPK
jgi:hypothetical protein